MTHIFAYFCIARIGNGDTNIKPLFEKSNIFLIFLPPPPKQPFIMDGKRIKKALLDAGVSQAELAEFMGTSPQNVNAALQSDNIKTGTLEQVAKFLGKPVSFFYGDGNVVATDNAVAAGNDANVGLEASALLGELKAQRKLTEQAMSQNDRLLGIIESMQKI